MVAKRFYFFFRQLGLAAGLLYSLPPILDVDVNLQIEPEDGAEGEEKLKDGHRQEIPQSIPERRLAIRPRLGIGTAWGERKSAQCKSS